MATVLKVNQRHRRTAVQFQRWLAKNPEASKKRQVAAFNVIADTEWKQAQEEKIKEVSKKLVKRI